MSHERAATGHDSAPGSAWRTALVALATLALTPAWAAPFEIRRTEGSPSQTRTSAVIATVSSGPFDDEPGLLNDGRFYCYTVEDRAGGTVRLSVDKNPVLGTVRLGFRDGDPASAAVDTVRSSVVVQPAVIPADGASLATVTVVPRDGNGVALGAGLVVTLDVNALLPGFPAGAVIDRGNGEYRLAVASWTAGAATAVVTVEGRVLADTPALTFETAPASLGPLADLEWVIAELRDTLDRDPGAGYAKELSASIDELQNALAELQKTPPDKKRAVDDIRRAVLQLTKAVDRGLEAGTGTEYLATLAGVARELAVMAIDLASVAGGDPVKIESARGKVAEGDARRASEDYHGAAQRYMVAVHDVNEAL